jgi:hypothetical protein
MSIIIDSRKDPFIAVPPQIYPSESYNTLYAERFQFGSIEGKIISAQIFTDGVAIWTNGEMIDMSRISGLTLPIDPTDAANKEYVDNALGGVPAGPSDAVQFNDNGMVGGNGDFAYNKITDTLTVNGTVTGLIAPTDPSDAANKAYVDSMTGTPAPPDYSIQFNDGTGQFGGTSDLIWTGTTLNINGTVDAINFVGTNVAVTTVTGSTLTDGFVIISGGSITGINSITATTITADLFTDGAGGDLSGGILTATTITDNIATLSGGVLSDVSQIDMPIVATIGTGVITGLANPTSPYDAANKAYVDAATGTAPGLPFNSIQYNAFGIFAGDSDFTWSPATTSVLNGTMTVNGEITDGTASLLFGSLSGVTTLDASGVVSFTDVTPSTSTTSGALIVSGGAGFGLDVNIGGECFASEFHSISDIAMKENIEPLRNSLDRLDKVECYSYNLIGSDRKTYGVIAQQLEEVGFEELVKEVSDHKTVSYTPLIALLIDSIKELKQEVNDLKKFKRDYSKEQFTESVSEVHKVVDNPIPSKKITKKTKEPKQTDRKNHKGYEYKYCFFCEDWTLISNFAIDSKELDSLKKNCKKHRC